MNRKEYLEKINKYFTYLVVEINCNTSSGLFDINSVAEDFYIPILKFLYECSHLENKNIIKSNFPAIDLGCEKSRISFQVTSENGSGKIIHTLEKFRENNLDASYDEVYILIITTKQKTYSSKLLDDEINRQEISFDKKSHIIDYTDIISKISKLETQNFKVVYEILEREFSKQETFNICRDELDSFLSISTNKIEIEKNTKKYIPSIFTESTKTKDLVRLFAHPLFFYRKIEDRLLALNYDVLNEYLSMMGLSNISSEIHSYIKSNSPKSIEDVVVYLNNLAQLIKKEKDIIYPFSPWGKSDNRPEFDVPDNKLAVKSLLKLKMESLGYGIEREYEDVLELIRLWAPLKIDYYP